MQCFPWGFIKDHMQVPPLPKDLTELKRRIKEYIASITPKLLIVMWKELDFWLDVCRITKSTDIEHL